MRRTDVRLLLLSGLLFSLLLTSSCGGGSAGGAVSPAMGGGGSGGGGGGTGGGGGGGGGGGTSTPTIGLSPSGTQSLDQNQTLALTAQVTNDPSNSGVSWSLSGPGSLSGQTMTA